MRKCSKCHIEKNDLEFPVDQIRKNGERYIVPRCKECKNLARIITYYPGKFRDDNVKRYWANPEKERAKVKDWVAKTGYNKKIQKRHTEYVKQWRLSNPEKVKEYNHIHNKGRTLNLCDSYIIHLLTDRNRAVKKEFIPKDVIELKRDVVKLVRLLKSKK